MPTKPVVRGILKEYLEIHEKHQKLYGDKAVVFMEVGSFYEIYALRLASCECGPNIDGICDILNIQVTRKKKDDPHSCSNPLMAGVPEKKIMKIQGWKDPKMVARIVLNGHPTSKPYKSKLVKH